MTMHTFNEFEDSAAELETFGRRLKTKKEEAEELRKEMQQLHQQQKETVIEALYDIQDSLDNGESVTLIDSSEWSRGGHYVFEEVLTPDGVIADNVERIFKGHGYTFDEDGDRVELTDEDVDDEYDIRGEDKYRDASSTELYGWDGQNEPLDIEDDYLSHHHRDTAGFIGKLAERIRHLEQGRDIVPSDGRGYD